MGDTRRAAGIWAIPFLIVAFVLYRGTPLLALPDLGGSLRANAEFSESSFMEHDGLTAIISLSDEAWKTSGRMQIQDNQLTQLDVTDDRTFGPFQMRSTCVFTPDTGFSQLSSTARFTIRDMQFANYVFLSYDPARSYDQVTARWQGDVVMVSGVTRLDICPMEFRSVQIAATWRVESCNLFIDVRSAFTGDEGFDYLRITGRLPEFPLLSNDLMSTELRLDMQFETDQKTFSPSFRTSTDLLNACLSPFLRLMTDTSNLHISGIDLYGWEGECDIGDRVNVYFATSLDPGSNREVTGDGDYRELWRLSSSMPGCCGRDPEWEVSMYFGADSTALFSREKTTFEIEFPWGQQVTTYLSSEFVETIPHWTIIAGVQVLF